MHGHCSGLSSLSSASKACSCTADAAACRLCRVPAKPAHARPLQRLVVSVECQQARACRLYRVPSSASKACSCTADAVACRLCRVPMTHPGEQQGLHHGGGRAASREAVRELRSRPRLRGDLGRAPLLFTGRHECEHGHEHLHEHERERGCESEGGQGGERVCERRTLPRRRQSRAALSLLTSGRCMQLSGRATSMPAPQHPYLRPA